MAHPWAIDRFSVCGKIGKSCRVVKEPSQNFKKYLTWFYKGVLFCPQVCYFKLFWKKNHPVFNFFFSLCRRAEAAPLRCSLKKMFLEIPQNSREKSYARVPFLKSCRSQVYNFIKKETLAQVFSKHTAKNTALSVSVFRDFLVHFLKFAGEI